MDDIAKLFPKDYFNSPQLPTMQPNLVQKCKFAILLNLYFTAIEIFDVELKAFGVDTFYGMLKSLAVHPKQLHQSEVNKIIKSIDLYKIAQTK